MTEALTLESAQAGDFPYYRTLSRRRVLLLGAGGLAGLAAFWGVGWFLHDTYTVLVPTALFVAVPLTALAVATRGSIGGLFRRVTGRDLLAMLGYALLCIVATVVMGFFVGQVSGATRNAVFDQIEYATPTWLAMFYPQSAVQLLGEELLTILPFLALLHWFAVRRAMDRTKAVVLAWVISSVGFGLVHLPAYQWNVLQCVLVVGAARLVLTWSYIRTKNLWVAYGAHVLNDWLLITPFILGEVASR
ncbi:CPBP family intramembrane glutamic endopeptidase [Asanoa siamensis]|uniref:CAAX prenyl protease 2/Lysostaphin resistance protein A-like domain-containing protein n=1 Tax=Asanoa siamensis TaxID=926357 RepID=A0ABQ4CK89_9ACTN|nr:type II CAAX endopeptidase family protein [Asanoa siamensis]GIF71710.1 hypothetical protein Asi02nite_12280 [Asanoa siamensis]